MLAYRLYSPVKGSKRKQGRGKQQISQGHIVQETETGQGYHLLVLEGEEDSLQGGWERPLWVRDR